MLESKIQKKIIDYIKKSGGDCVKITSSRRGLPDLLACVNGRLILIEVKREGGSLDPLQEYFFMRWNYEKINCIMVDSVDMLKIKLKEIL